MMSVIMEENAQTQFVLLPKPLEQFAQKALNVL
jgi:hypothetical protein